MSEWRQYLGELNFAPLAEQDAWLAAHPLRAMLPGQAIGEIRRCDLNRFAPAEPGGSFRMLLRLHTGPSFINLLLPSDLTYSGLQFVDLDDDPRRYLIVFETDEGTVTTNPQELMREFSAMTLERDLGADGFRARFLGLSNAFDVPVMPKPMTPIISRHLGEVVPDQWGEADASLSIPALSTKPLDVMISHLGGEDAGAIDAVLDLFIGEIASHLDRVTPQVFENMRDFCQAVYRDPDGAPLTDATRDDAFEAILALSDPKKIWNHVKPYALNLMRLGDPDQPPAPQRISDGPIYLTLIARCDWEIEHGLGLVWRDGHVFNAVGAGDVHPDATA